MTALALYAGCPTTNLLGMTEPSLQWRGVEPPQIEHGALDGSGFESSAISGSKHVIYIVEPDSTPRMYMSSM